MSNNCGCDAQSLYIPSQKGNCLPAGSERLIMDNNQRIIQGTVRASAGEYLMNKKKFIHGKNGENLDNGSAVMQKHDSYSSLFMLEEGRGCFTRRKWSFYCIEKWW